MIGATRKRAACSARALLEALILRAERWLRMLCSCFDSSLRSSCPKRLSTTSASRRSRRVPFDSAASSPRLSTPAARGAGDRLHASTAAAFALAAASCTACGRAPPACGSRRRFFTEAFSSLSRFCFRVWRSLFPRRRASRPEEDAFATGGRGWADTAAGSGAPPPPAGSPVAIAFGGTGTGWISDAPPPPAPPAVVGGGRARQGTGAEGGAIGGKPDRDMARVARSPNVRVEEDDHPQRVGL